MGRGGRGEEETVVGRSVGRGADSPDRLLSEGKDVPRRTNGLISFAIKVIQSRSPLLLVLSIPGAEFLNRIDDGMGGVQLTLSLSSFHPWEPPSLFLPSSFPLS